MTTLDPKKLIEKVDLNIIDRHSIPNSSYSSFNNPKTGISLWLCRHTEYTRKKKQL